MRFELLWPLVGRKKTEESMTARSKLLGQKKEAASSFCPSAPVESFFGSEDSTGERSFCGDIDRVVT